MRNRKTTVIAFLLAMAMLLSLAPAGQVIAIDEEPAPRLRLSGIDVRRIPGEGGAVASYQAIYTLRITGQDIATAGFTLRYNRDYLYPSASGSNATISAVSEGASLDAMFAEDADLMDSGVFIMPDITYHNYSGTETGNYGLLSYRLAVMGQSEYDPPNPIEGGQDGGVVIGTFSFRLGSTKLVELSSMEVSQLKELVTLYPDTAAANLEDLGVGWTDENSDPHTFSDLDLWEMDVELNMPPESAEAILLDDTVTAYEIYSAGTVEDLFNYVRDNSTSAIVTFIGGNASVEPFQWGTDTDTTGMTLSAGTYDPKGGTYTVSQTDPDLGEVTVDVTVTPVNVTGFLASTNDYVCYDPGTQPADISAITDFPTTAKVLFDVLLPSGAASTAAIDGTWAQTSPDTPTYYTDGTPSYTFTADIDQADIPAWATLDTTTVDASVDVVRFVGPRADPPEVLCAEVQDDGTLIIMVEALDPEDRDFVVRLPDGTEVTPTVAAGENYTDKDGNEYTGVKVTVDPSTPGTPDVVKESLNLGGSGFGIAVAESDATPPEYGESEFTAFALDPRNNYFTTDAADGGSYVFDYSGNNKGLYPFVEGSSLPTTFTLPGADFVSTTYDGADGSEYGKLQTFEVLWDTPVGDPSQAGQDVEYTGTLQTTTTENGIVTNPNGVTIKVKVTTVEAATYIVTLKTNPADGSYGTLTFGGDDDTNSFTTGSMVTIVVTPVTGYQFVGFSCVPNTVTPTDTGAGDGSYTFTMPASNVTVTARFQANTSSAVGDISVYKSDDDTEIYSLHEYSDGLGAEVEFDPDTTEYYVRVPAATESVKLLVGAGSEPEVTYSSDTVTTDTAVAVTDDGSGGFETDTIPLNSTAPDLGNPPGFNNIVRITVDSTEYVVYIQRLVEARIELNYGNSPYGMIMRSSVISDENKQAAKDAFAAGDGNGNYRFSTTDDSLVPTDLMPVYSYETRMHHMSKTKLYSAYAWAGTKNHVTGEAVNGDLDDYAIFAYTGRSFKDPGFTVYDELGNVVGTDVDAEKGIAASDITDVYVAAATGVLTYSETNTTTLTRGEGGVYETNGMVRTDVYEITYTYTYTPIDGTEPVTVTEKRTVVLLGQLGDGLLTAIVGVSNLDGTRVTNSCATWGTSQMVNNTSASLFLYRVCETQVTTIAAVSNLDGTWITNHATTLQDWYQFYPLLEAS